MNTTARPVWTDVQEARLLELQQQKAAAMAANREPVAQLAAEFAEHCIGHTPDPAATLDEVTGFFIANATALRAALAPFDREAS